MIFVAVLYVTVTSYQGYATLFLPTSNLLATKPSLAMTSTATANVAV